MQVPQWLAMYTQIFCHASTNETQWCQLGRTHPGNDYRDGMAAWVDYLLVNMTYIYYVDMQVCMYRYVPRNIYQTSTYIRNVYIPVFMLAGPDVDSIKQVGTYVLT